MWLSQCHARGSQVRKRFLISSAADFEKAASGLLSYNTHTTALIVCRFSCSFSMFFLNTIPVSARPPLVQAPHLRSVVPCWMIITKGLSSGKLLLPDSSSPSITGAEIIFTFTILHLHSLYGQQDDSVSARAARRQTTPTNLINFPDSNI